MLSVTSRAMPPELLATQVKNRLGACCGAPSSTTFVFGSLRAATHSGKFESWILLSADLKN